jgi:hypothetical protein
VPDKTPVAVLNVTPVGRAPDRERVGAGYPEAVTVNDPAWPTVNVCAFALLNAGFSLMISVKFWVVELTELVAVKVSE